MDRAIAPGAEKFLKGRGGLRAKILSDGELRSTSRVAETSAPDLPDLASPSSRERVG